MKHGIPITLKLVEKWWSDLRHLTALVAEHEGVIIGYAQIMKSPRPRLRGIGEFLIYLHQDFQNVGLGTAMTRIIVGFAKEEGLHRIGLSVVSDNRSAIHVYEKFGLKVDGACRDAFFDDDGKYYDLIYMGLILG